MEYLGPLLLKSSNLIPLINYTQHNVWHEITCPVQPLKFRNGYVISSNTFGVWLLINAGMKVNPC